KHVEEFAFWTTPDSPAPRLSACKVGTKRLACRLGVSRQCLRQLCRFLDSPLRTVHAAFTAHVAPEIDLPCHGLLRGSSVVRFHRDCNTSSASDTHCNSQWVASISFLPKRQSPGVLPHVAGFPDLRVL